MRKYTDAQKKQVRQMFAAGHKQARIAEQTGIPRTTVGQWCAGRLRSGSHKALEAHTEKLRAQARQKTERIEQALQQHGAMPNSLIRQHVAGMSRDPCNRYLMQLESEGRVERLEGPRGARWRATHGQAIDRFIYRRAA